MKIKHLVAAAAVVAFLPMIPSFANAASVTVDGTTDIFLASQLSGSQVSGYFGTDSAPANSPVQLNVSAGATLTFLATGSASVDGGCYTGPDGGCYGDESGYSPAPASGTYKGPATALVGVFLGNGVTSVQNGPASLDYTQDANKSLASQSPTLDQIFFIGDGLTGTGSGATQQFIAPTGATRLYLAVADSIGASTGNPGGFDVAFTGATAVSAVPLPAALPLMATAFAGLVGVARKQRRA